MLSIFCWVCCFFICLKRGFTGEKNYQKKNQNFDHSFRLRHGPEENFNLQQHNIVILHILQSYLLLSSESSKARGDSKVALSFYNHLTWYSLWQGRHKSITISTSNKQSSQKWIKTKPCKDNHSPWVNRPARGCSHHPQVNFDETSNLQQDFKGVNQRRIRGSWW